MMDDRILAIAFHSAQVMGVKFHEIMDKSRGRVAVAKARQIAMYQVHTLLGIDMEKIGSWFGRDRTTVSHACSKIEDLRDNPVYDKLIDEVERRFKRGYPLG